LAEAAATMWLSNNVPFAISFTSYLADIVVAQGRLGEATRICQDAIERARLQADGVLDETAVLHLCLCEIPHERREDGAAQEHMAVSAARGELVTFPSWYRRWPHARARLAVAARDLDQALEALADGERLFYRHSVPDVRPLSAMKARVWIEQGRLPEAGAWASERRLSIDDDLTYLREYEHITLARLLVAKTRRDRVPDAARGALALLARLLQAAEAGGRSGSVIEILVLQTIAHAALGDSGAARHVGAEPLRWPSRKAGSGRSRTKAGDGSSGVGGRPSRTHGGACGPRAGSGSSAASRHARRGVLRTRRGGHRRTSPSL
ncbi:MAG: hypothetical protein M5U09_05275, partial [Gammaproteobacteria bacterium]|nr:hypothetical protein [Gammaproteobacteria bacterium]